MQRWEGKTAVVTGASAGIGAEIAKSLAEAGVIVVAAARRMDKLQELQKRCKGRILAHRCDMGSRDDVISLIKFAKEKAGGIDILINNAAVLPRGTITDCSGHGTSLDDIEGSFATNVLGVITATRLAASDMLARKVKGHIVFINSIAGHKTINMQGTVMRTSVYGATKHTITELVEGIRLEFSHAAAPIRITSISPGAVDTAMLHSVPDLPDATPMLKTIDIANAVIYALSTPDHVNITELTIQVVGEAM